MGMNFMLVTVCDREITAQLSESLADATLTSWENQWKTLSEVDKLTGELKHSSYHWRIVPTEDATAGETVSNGNNEILVSKLLETEGHQILIWILDFRDDSLIARLLVQAIDVSSDTLLASYQTGDKILARIVFQDLCNEISTKGSVKDYVFPEL